MGNKERLVHETISLVTCGFLETVAQEDRGQSDDETRSEENHSCTQSPTIFYDTAPEVNISLEDIQFKYIRFLLQLREEYLLPKKVISIISSNIVALLEGIEELVQQRSTESPSHPAMTEGNLCPVRVIESNVLTAIIRDISRTVESTTRSEYEFIQLCKRFMGYKVPQEILLSDPGDIPEYDYVIPVAEK